MTCKKYQPRYWSLCQTLKNYELAVSCPIQQSAIKVDVLNNLMLFIYIMYICIVLFDKQICPFDGHVYVCKTCVKLICSPYILIIYFFNLEYD